MFGTLEINQASVSGILLGQCGRILGRGGGGFCSESTTFSSTTWQCLAEELSFQNSAGVEIGRWLMHRPGVASARLDGISVPLDDTQEVNWRAC